MGILLPKPQEPESWISSWPDVEFPCLVARVEDITAYVQMGTGERILNIKLEIDLPDAADAELAERIFGLDKRPDGWMLKKFVRIAHYPPDNEDTLFREQDEH